MLNPVAKEEEEDEHEINIDVGAYAQSSSQRNDRNLVLHRGSVLNHCIIYRNRELGNQLIYRDYFSDHPTYPDYTFRRRFRMRRSLFVRIQSAIESHDPYFVQRCDAVGVLGLSPFQKMIAALRKIAYGLPADAIDDYVRIDESAAIESLRKLL